MGFLWGFNPNRLDSHPKALGRREPKTDLHIRSFPLTIATPASVETFLKLPWWHWLHDQGNEGACVGFGSSMERAIANTSQRRLAHAFPATVRYDPWWLWDSAKAADEWPDTNPGDNNGTSVHAAYDVLRERGHIRERVLTSQARTNGYPQLSEGVSANRWATSVDEIRACIKRGAPVTIGINWYENFDDPVLDTTGRNWWIGRDRDLGDIRGGHCVCIYAASDRHQAFRVKNSWGRAYPLIWLPYTVMERLLSEDGEAVVATDR